MTIAEIEDMLAEKRLSAEFHQVKQKHDELMSIMGNVEDDDTIALTLVAYDLCVFT